jgi:hypothetical protein
VAGERRSPQKIMQHWVRHPLATTMMAMCAPLLGIDQGSRLGAESYMGCVHDMRDVRRPLTKVLPCRVNDGPGDGLRAGAIY